MEDGWMSSVSPCLRQSSSWLCELNRRCARRFTHKTLNRRTVAEIQKKIIKLGKRSTVSRLLHAKDDKETIAAWGLDLNRILHVFSVGSTTFVRPLLTVRFQTELAIGTHVAVSGVQQGVSEPQHNTTDIHTIVSDIHHVVVGSQEGTDGTNQSVSVTCTLTESVLTAT